MIGTDIPASVTFNHIAGTISIVTNQPLTTANMLMVVNSTRNQVMLNFIDPSLAYTVSSFYSNSTALYTNTITFGYSTASMADTDLFQIYVDVQGIQESLEAFLRRLVSLNESNGVVDSSGRLRINVESITTAAVTNTTGLGPNVVGSTPGSNTPYAAPANIATLTVSEGPVDQRWRIIDAAQTTYGVALRNQLVW